MIAIVVIAALAIIAYRVSNSALVEVAIRELNERSDDEIRALFRKHPNCLAYPIPPERAKP